MNRIFTLDDTWTGGAFELLLYLGPDTESVLRSIRAIWSHSSLVGPFPSNDREPSTQSVAACDSPEFSPDIASYGVATLPNGSQVACSHYVVSDANENWLYFGIPMGSLGTAYNVGAYPFGDGLKTDWMIPVTNWLRAIAECVFIASPFDAAVIGWLTAIEVDELLSVAAGSVPEKRYHSYLQRDDNALTVFSVTEIGPLMT